MSNQRKETSYVIVHSSHTTPKENLDVKDLDTEHRKQGLFSCAFHYIIKRDGTVQEGRDIFHCIFSFYVPILLLRNY